MNDNNTKVLKVSGKKIDDFFQNLITNDIKRLEQEKSIYTCVLTPQGKFLNDFFLVKKEQSLYLEINNNEITNLKNLLNQYDLRRQFIIKEENNLQTFVCLKKDFDYFKEKLKKKEYENLEIFESFKDPRDNNYLIRLWIKQSNKQKEFNLLEKSYNLEIEFERIKRLIPNSEIDLEKNKSFILQFGFDKINAISFDKGCYVGQENTARQKYRGKQKYELKLLKILEGHFPSFNTELKYLDKKIGIMKSYAGKYGLALVKTDVEFLNEKLYEIPPMFKVLVIN